MTTPHEALVAILASADPGELLTWAQLEDLADAALAAGWVSPVANAVRRRGRSRPGAFPIASALSARRTVSAVGSGIWVTWQ